MLKHPVHALQSKPTPSIIWIIGKLSIGHSLEQKHVNHTFVGTKVATPPPHPGGHSKESKDYPSETSKDFTKELRFKSFVKSLLAPDLPFTRSCCADKNPFNPALPQTQLLHSIATVDCGGPAVH